jgi:hypothetical protein
MSEKKPARQAIKYSVDFNGCFAVKAKAYFENTYHKVNSSDKKMWLT